jgi:hypothetical protein
MDESVINITKQDHNQTNQHSYLEYLVHESHQPFLPINLKPVMKKKFMRWTKFEMEKLLWVWWSTIYDCKIEYAIYLISVDLYL